MREGRQFIFHGPDGREHVLRAVMAEGPDGQVFGLETRLGTDLADIVDAAPDEVRPDLLALAAVAGCKRDGTPPHYMQAALDLRRGNVHDALWSLRGGSTVEELAAVADSLAEAFADKGSATFLKAEVDAVAAARRVAVARVAAAATGYFDVPERRSDEVEASMARVAFHEALLDLDDALVALPSRVRSEAQVERHGRLALRAKLDVEALAIAEGGALSPARSRRLHDAVEKCLATREIVRLVSGTVAARWAGMADAASEALDRPDYILEPGGEPDERPVTALGYASARRLDLLAFKPRRVPGIVEPTYEWSCRMKTPERFPETFVMTSRAMPTWADVATLLRDDPGSPAAVTVADVLGREHADGLARTRERVLPEDTGPVPGP